MVLYPVIISDRITIIIQYNHNQFKNLSNVLMVLASATNTVNIYVMLPFVGLSFTMFYFVPIKSVNIKI